jgi:hypothetical protein
MKTWQKILIPTLITLAIGGIYLFSVWKHRQNPGVIGQRDASQALSEDDVAVVRTLFPAHFEDLQQLEGKSVWMKNGYTMPYFSYLGGQVEFGKRVGLIPSAERLDVKKIVKAAVPATVDDSVNTAAGRPWRCSRCREARSCSPHRLATCRETKKLITQIFCSSTTTRTVSTTIGRKTSGPPSTRTN